MANELNIALANSGLTVTAQRYQSGAAVGSAISLSEISTSGVYTGNMSGAAGTYQLAFISAGKNVGSGQIVWDGTNEVASSAPTAADNASAVWSATSRTITGGTVTTLTNAPTVPSASAIAQQVRTELSVELSRLDQAISTRLASASYAAPATAAEITSAVWAAADKTGYSLTSTERTAIATAVESSLLNENDGQQILNAIVGAIGNQNIDQIGLVAAIRSDLERTGGKLDSIPTTAAPSASAVASATRTELSTELSRIDQNISSRLASASYVAPTAPPTVVEIRQEIDANSTKLDAAISTRLASTASSDIAAIKAVTDDLDPITERLANVATTNIVGTLLAQANS